MLYEVITEQVIAKGDYLQISPMIETTSADEVREFHAKQLGLGLEGAMVKKYDGVYQPGRSGWNWVKFKEVEEAKGKLSDTIDAVVMGYYRGKGKRRITSYNVCYTKLLRNVFLSKLPASMIEFGHYARK